MFFFKRKTEINSSSLNEKLNPNDLKFDLCSFASSYPKVNVEKKPRNEKEDKHYEKRKESK